MAYCILHKRQNVVNFHKLACSNNSMKRDQKFSLVRKQEITFPKSVKCSLSFHVNTLMEFSSSKNVLNKEVLTKFFNKENWKCN